MASGHLISRFSMDFIQFPSFPIDFQGPDVQGEALGGDTCAMSTAKDPLCALRQGLERALGGWDSKLPASEPRGLRPEALA